MVLKSKPGPSNNEMSHTSIQDSEETGTTSEQENKEGDKQTQSKRCSILIVVGTIGIVVGTIIICLGLSFCIFLALLKSEEKVRLRLHDTRDNFTATWITIIFLFCLPDALLNYAAKQISKYFLGKKIKTATTLYFIIFWVCNSITSYIPVLFRIYLYGNIVGTPEEGYQKIITLRFKHCLQFGCIDTAVYLTGVMAFSHIVIPLFKCIKSYCCCCCCFCCCCYCCCSCGNDSSTCIKKHCGCCYDKDKQCCTSTLYNIIFYSNTADKYVELTVLYGYTIFFISVAGFFPLVIALISVPITAKEIANSYHKQKSGNSTEQEDVLNNKKLDDKAALRLYTVWTWVLLGMTCFSMFTNIAHVIPNSRFLQHISYSTSTGYHSSLDLDGYFDFALPQHSFTRLIQIGAFPNYNAHYLPQKDKRGKAIKDANGKEKLYLPFVNFDCLKKKGNIITWTTSPGTAISSL